MGIRMDAEIRRRDYSLKSLKHSLAEQRRKASAVDGLRKRWEMVLDGVIVPVGLFPAQKEGHVLLRRVLRREEVSGLLSAEVVYTDDKGNRDLLDSKNVIWSDTSLVREYEGCRYVRMEDVEKAIAAYKSRLRLEDIIRDYRKERS